MDFGFDDVKSIFASKTIWGLVMVALPTVAKFAGLNLDAATATEAVNTVVAFGGDAMLFVGWALAFWGRLTAKKTLVLVK